MFDDTHSPFADPTASISVNPFAVSTDSLELFLINVFSLSGACHEDVAASTSIDAMPVYPSRRLAVARPKLSGRRSSSTVLSQVCLGLPVLRRQSLGGLRIQDRRAREWS